MYKVMSFYLVSMSKNKQIKGEFSWTIVGD